MLHLFLNAHYERYTGCPASFASQEKFNIGKPCDAGMKLGGIIFPYLHSACIFPLTFSISSFNFHLSFSMNDHFHLHFFFILVVCCVEYVK